MLWLGFGFRAVAWLELFGALQNVYSFMIDGFGALAGRLAVVFGAVDDSKEDAFVQG